MYNVDFFIEINHKFIGLQIKPINNRLQLPEIHKEYALQARTHKKFEEQFGGKVFYVFSIKESGRKVIANPEVVGGD